MTEEFLSFLPVLFTFGSPLLLLHHKTTTLYCWSGAGLPPPFFYRQSIYPDLARIDGCCRDCRVDSMLQDLSTDRHTAWQLQNGASMQPSDLLDFPSPSCFSYYWWFHLCLMHLIYFWTLFGLLKWEHVDNLRQINTSDYIVNLCCVPFSRPQSGHTWYG